MKPAAFTYHRPSSVDEAIALLASLRGADVRILAGGQSLIPMMAFRVSKPEHVIDINEVAGIDRAYVDGDTLVIGATVRHAAFHEHVAPGPLGPLLTAVAREIAHYPIRQRGTFCGSLAHADPASEWCLVAVTLDAELVIRSADETRSQRAAEFLLSGLVTDIQDGEMLVAARLPLLSPQTRFGFAEFNRRPGDFGQAAVLAVCEVTGGIIRYPRIGVGGAEELPRRLEDVENHLAGQEPSEALFRAAAQTAADVIEPVEDAQIPTGYRRELVRLMTLQALNCMASFPS